MFAVIGASAVMILLWIFMSKKDSSQFIDTKSIQIDSETQSGTGD